MNFSLHVQRNHEEDALEQIRLECKSRCRGNIEKANFHLLLLVPHFFLEAFQAGSVPDLSSRPLRLSECSPCIAPVICFVFGVCLVEREKLHPVLAPSSSVQYELRHLVRESSASQK